MSKKVLYILISLVFLVVIFFSRENIYFSIGNYYFGGGVYDLKKAEKYFRKVVSIEEDYPRAHYQLARISFLNARFIEAKNEINKEISLYPDFYKSYYMEGLIAGYAGDFETAVNGFKKFQEYDSFNWASYNDLSWVYFQKGDFELARDIAVDGLRYAGNNPWLYNSLGIALINLKDMSEAKVAFEKALENIDKTTAEQWGKAYPGNDPKIYKDGHMATREAIIYNLDLLKDY
ncbi:MAG: tetratricopeptide repeat protein [Patescibacteria group bacterium]